MSLKSFHIVFIAISALFAFGLAYWSMAEFMSSGSMLLIAAAIASFISGFALIVYGIHFLKKLKHVSFL